MTFTVEQKSQLAKLMATENLRVEHQKIRTAKFDTKNRVLYLPIWQNMTGDLYDLLTGHEVGHALFTPPEGWHDAVLDKSKGKHFKHFLNVVEDARIEKKVKRRYPGLKMSFQRAYMELMDRDFFGIADRDVNEMPFIDRLNIFTKSQYSATYIKFTDEEMALIGKVENLETWDDVLNVTEEVYNYSKNEQYQIQNEHFEFDDSYDYDESDEYEDDDSGVSQEDEETGAEQESDSGQKSEKKADKDSESKEDSEKDDSDAGKDEDAEGETGDDTGKQLNREKQSNDSHSDQFEPECETDESYRQNENSLLDEKCKEYVYVTVPKPILKNIVTPAKRVHELLTEFYFKGCLVRRAYSDPYFYRGVKTEDVKTWVNDFKQKNERYVGLLVKEFEMRKAAKSFSKSKLSDTGDIDINKLSSYKFDDNIFRKVMLTPKGKNHGLVLLLDRSGSMSSNMSGSIEQILVLSMFCRKVNIPFVVYGFGDAVEANLIDIGDKTLGAELLRSKKIGESFVKEEMSIAFDHVFLREYLNSKMSNSEYSTAVRNMIILKKSYESGRYGNTPRPLSEELSNTPLTQAIFATGYIMREFRKQYNLEMTSLVIVHDGDSDTSNRFWKTTEFKNEYGVKKPKQITMNYYPKQQNVILRDTEKKFEHKIGDSQDYDESLLAALTWFKATTDSKIFGFYITSDRVSTMRSCISYRYFNKDGNLVYDRGQRGAENTTKQLVDTLLKQLREEKFLISHNKGYDSFYFIAGGNDLKIEDDDLQIDGKVTASKLKNAFMKLNKKKVVNRVLVSKFIQNMAA
jgi:hypothetical protein